MEWDKEKNGKEMVTGKHKKVYFSMVSTVSL